MVAYVRDRPRHAPDGTVASGRRRWTSCRPPPRSVRAISSRPYESRLAQHGTRAAPILLTAADIAARTDYLNARQTLQRLIAWGVVLVVDENDTTATDEITFGDNNLLAAQVAILLDARLLVLLTNTDGLYTADPSLDSGAEQIEQVTDFAELADLEISDRTSAFGSGGIRSKVAAAEDGQRGRDSGRRFATAQCSGTLAAAEQAKTTGTRFIAQAEQGFQVQALAQVRQAARGNAFGRRRCCRAVVPDNGSSLLAGGHR